MKTLLAFILLTSAVAAAADNGNILIDIDCDGIPEQTKLKVSERDFAISVETSSNKTKSTLKFGLNQPSQQDSICGLKPELSSGEAATKDMHFEMFGGDIDGYKYSKSCKELVINGGECDPIYVFFNHKTGVINWLRL